MYTLYGAPGSGSAAIEIALAMAGQPLRLVEGATWLPGPGFDELRRVNPLHQVPTLQLPDGSVMSESAAILAHLGLVHPDSGLLPDDPSRRAQVLRGLVYIAANGYAAIGVIDYPERWTAEPAHHEALRAGARARLHATWTTFADLFPADPWLGGARPGALDVLAFVVSQWSGARAHLAQARPALHEALERFGRLPKVAPVMARHRGPQAPGLPAQQPASGPPP